MVGYVIILLILKDYYYFLFNFSCEIRIILWLFFDNFCLEFTIELRFFFGIVTLLYYICILWGNSEFCYYSI